MKICIIQPYYSFEEKDTAKCYDDMVALMERCDDSMDIIVLPEYSDVPADQLSKQGYDAAVEKYNSDIIRRTRETAVRCNAVMPSCL